MDKIIKIENLLKSYRDVTAVSDFTLEVVEGEMFGLVGPDGAGKTTLVRTLCGILKPDSGEFTIFDLDGVKNKNRIKKRIGYLSQKFSLYGDLTIDENIAFFAKIHNVKDYKQKKDVLLEKMGISQFTKRLAERLSGGMKQKLALACTLIHSPDLLFLDEPTTGVDPVSRREFWQILAGLKKDGITIFVTTPYLDEAERCDRVAFMYKGNVLTIDSPKNIKDNFENRVLEVVCSPVREIYGNLKKITAIEDIYSFGERLHIVFNENKISKTDVEKYLDEKNYIIQSKRIVSPSLEDIFIRKIRISSGE